MSKEQVRVTANVTAGSVWHCFRAGDIGSLTGEVQYFKEYGTCYRVMVGTMHQWLQASQFERTLDLNAAVFTLEGTPVVVVTTQGRDEKYPVLAYEGKATTLSKYTLEGKSKSGVARRHLTNVQAAPEPEREFFVNLYDDSEGWNGNTDDTLHLTKEAAAKYDAQQRTTHENFPKRAGLGKVVLVEGRLPKSILKQLDKKG